MLNVIIMTQWVKSNERRRVKVSLNNGQVNTWTIRNQIVYSSLEHPVFCVVKVEVSLCLPNS